MRLRFVSSVAVAALLVGACGDDSGGDGDDTATDPYGADDAPDTTAEAAPDETAPADDTAAGPVQTVDSDLGEVLADSEGFTLYGFTEDTGGTPSCYDECAGLWPPVTVDGDEVPEGLDPEVFSLTERDDGEQQLVAGDWPLYLYAQDQNAGDTNGQDVGGVWFAVSPDGELVGDAAGGDDGDGY